MRKKEANETVKKCKKRCDERRGEAYHPNWSYIETSVRVSVPPPSSNNGLHSSSKRQSSSAAVRWRPLGSIDASITGADRSANDGCGQCLVASGRRVCAPGCRRSLQFFLRRKRKKEKEELCFLLADHRATHRACLLFGVKFLCPLVEYKLIFYSKKKKSTTNQLQNFATKNEIMVDLGNNVLGTEHV